MTRFMKRLVWTACLLGSQGCGGCVDSTSKDAPAQVSDPAPAPAPSTQHLNPRFMRSPALDRAHAVDAQAD